MLNFGQDRKSLNMTSQTNQYLSVVDQFWVHLLRSLSEKALFFSSNALKLLFNIYKKLKQGKRDVSQVLRPIFDYL